MNAQREMTVRFVLLILVCGIFIGNAVSTTIYVDAVNGSDGWPGTSKQPKQSIGAAISIAIDLDEIVVRAGTYTGPNNRNLQPGARNIVICSESGPGVTIIDAEGLDRVFRIQLAPATAKVKGFTIQNGYTNTLMEYGGGGGGIYLIQTGMTIEDCIIRNCTGPEGAGMAISNCAGAKIVNCIFQQNIGTHTSMVCRSGAAAIFMSSDVEFSGCKFISNRVQPTVNTGHGGAFYLWRYDATFTNCVFEGNYAKGSGGVAYIEDGMLTFDQCTFYGNSCGGSGGCFFVGYMGSTHEVVCTNSIFRSNSAGGSGNVAYLLGVGTAGGAFRYGYCDINPSEIAHAAPGGWVIQNLGGNMNCDPLFASTGYWDGGAGLWIPGDYHLKSMVGRFNIITGGWNVDAVQSPCIDAGDPADDYSDEPQHNGERVNMGAYGASDEASQSPYCSTPIPEDLTNDCRVDIADFAQMAAVWMSCNVVPADFCW